MRVFFERLKPISRLNPIFWIFLFFGLIILTNQIHYFYEDEFENILAGHFILTGRLPYTGFFTHHNPAAFFISTIINLISGVSFVRFRILLGAVYLSWYILFFIYIKKKFGVLESKIVLLFYLFVTFGATFNWAHMLLADTLSAYLLTPVYIVCLLIALKGAVLGKKDLWLLSLLTSFTIFTTFTQLYACLLIYLFIFILNIKSKGVSWKNFFIIVLLPFLLFILYLVSTGSVLEYYRQAIDFNVSHYVQLPDNASVRNPLRVIIIFLVNFFQEFKSAFLQVKDLSFGSPFVHTLALSNVGLMVYLAIKRKFYLLLLVWLFLSFINARGNPYTTSETDYQAVVYHFVSIFNGLLAMVLLWKEVSDINLRQQYDHIKGSEYNKKLLLNGLIILLGLYQISLFFFFFDRWLDKSYKKFMGVQALIYDRPPIAPTLNNLLSSLQSEYYYIAPFDFENQLYMHTKPASKYIIILPGMDNVPRIQQELLSDLKKNRPKVIVFNSELSIYQAYPGKFFQQFLNEEYINLEALGMPCNGYKSKQKWFRDYDFERHFFFEKNKKDQVIPFLLERNLIYQISQEEIDQIPRCRELKQNLQKQKEDTTSKK